MYIRKKISLKDGKLQIKISLHEVDAEPHLETAINTKIKKEIFKHPERKTNG